ncbi:MAG TPA: MFS transporter [Acidobacteriaceae bacterium]
MLTTTNADVADASVSLSTNWSAVGSMAMCVALLIAAEFMPVSLLTPIASDLHASVGMAGQAISISGLFAVVTSLYIATFAARYDRRHVLIGLTAVMLLSLILIALAPNFFVLMLARAMLGLVIGGFWSLATATVMRLVSEDAVTKALGAVYMGNALATGFAAPIGSYLGGIIGWRGVFWALVPLGAITMLWQWISLPTLPPQAANPVSKLLGLLKRRNVAFAMVAVMLTFAGAFATFTYLRPFLETRTHVTLTELSLLLLGLGLAGFVGTSAASALAKRHLYLMLGLLPILLAGATVWMLLTQHFLWSVALAMIAWGTINSAIPVCWSMWLSQGIRDEPESGGGLMVGAIQLSIMAGGAFGGYLLDRTSIAGTFLAGCVFLLLSACVACNGSRLRPAA